MGTIAQKLEYLNDTRLLLKDNINKINNVLTDESTFRSYPQELFNGYLDILNNGTDTLWNNLEKVSQTGTEAVLENVETAPIKMVLNGNTSQETTTGKQLFDKTLTPISSSNATITQLDTGLRLTITSTSGNAKIRLGGSELLGKTITISAKIKVSSTNTTRCYLSYANNSGTNILSAGSTTLNETGVVSYTIRSEMPEGATQIVMVFLSDGADTNYVDFTDFMIVEGTYTSENMPDYEKYTGGQPSPNPDYPQQVKVVKGENVVSVQSKNLYTTSNLISVPTEITIIDNNSFSYEGNVSWSGITTAVNNLKKNTDYVINFESTSNTGYCQIKTMDNITITEKYVYYFANGIPFNSGDNTSVKVIINPRTESGTFYNIQLEEGTAKTDFVPYSKTDYPINLGDIELCKINTYKEYFHKDSGKWYVHKEKNKIAFDGSENFTIFSSNTSRVVFLINISGDIANYVDATKVPNLICSHFVAVAQNKTWANGDISRHTANQKGLYFTTKADETIDTFKNWLSSNNVSVYYPLATPTETEITNTTLISQLEAISKAKSVKDKTYITQTNEELPFILDVEAIKEYEVN